MGMTVTRIMSDNLSVNSRMYRILSASGKTASNVKAPLKINPDIEHPCDKDRPLFISFDYCHVVKNIRSKFLRHNYRDFIK